MHLNLLPTSTRLLIQFDQQLRIYLRLWLTLGLAATIYLIYQLFLGYQAQQRLSLLDVACEPVRQTQAQLHQDRQWLTELHKKQADLIALHIPAHPVAILGAIVKAIANQPGKVHLQRLSIQADQAVASTANATQATSAQSVTARSPSHTHSLVLMGQADDDSALSKLITQLRNSDWIQRVELKSSSRSTSSAARQFHLEGWYGTGNEPQPTIAN